MDTPSRVRGESVWRSSAAPMKYMAATPNAKMPKAESPAELTASARCEPIAKTAARIAARQTASPPTSGVG